MTEDLRHEMIRLLTILTQGYASDDEEDVAVCELNRISPDPQILNYVFHPAKGEPDCVEAAVDRALTFQPIRL